MNIVCFDIVPYLKFLSRKIADISPKTSPITLAYLAKCEGKHKMLTKWVKILIKMKENEPHSARIEGSGIDPAHNSIINLDVDTGLAQVRVNIYLFHNKERKNKLWMVMNLILFSFKVTYSFYFGNVFTLCIEAIYFVKSFSYIFMILICVKSIHELIQCCTIL